MPLSIRNPRAEQLAREVAAETGETLTRAVIRSLEERLQRLRGRLNINDVAVEILDVSRRCRALPDQDQRSGDEILKYGDCGVPRRW